MANINWFDSRSCWRIVFNVVVSGRRVRRAKYEKKKSDAVQLRRALERVETASRSGLATIDEIVDWIKRGWIKPEEATQVFVGFTRDILRQQEEDVVLSVDFQKLLDAYEEYALDHSKAHDPSAKSSRRPKPSFCPMAAPRSRRVAGATSNAGFPGR